VPNRETENYALARAAKEDSRYSVTKEGTGNPAAPWVARFVGEWVACDESEDKAWLCAGKHNADRLARITN